jgi:hypothetical protein
MEMRKVLVPVAIAALALGVWLSTKEPSPDSAVAVPASVIAPVPPLPDSQSITAPEETQAVVAAEAVKATRDQPPPIFRVVYQEAEFRNGLVAYLVENGLAASDSERIADQAVEGLVDCSLTHGWRTEERRLAASRCEEGVLQQAGLNETIRRAALDSVSRRNEAGRNNRTQPATEAIAEPRAPQATQ